MLKYENREVFIKQFVLINTLKTSSIDLDTKHETYKHKYLVGLLGIVQNNDGFELVIKNQSPEIFHSVRQWDLCCQIQVPVFMTLQMDDAINQCNNQIYNIK